MKCLILKADNKAVYLSTVISMKSVYVCVCIYIYINYKVNRNDIKCAVLSAILYFNEFKPSTLQLNSWISLRMKFHPNLLLDINQCF